MKLLLPQKIKDHIEQTCPIRDYDQYHFTHSVLLNALEDFVEKDLKKYSAMLFDLYKSSKGLTERTLRFAWSDKGEPDDGALPKLRDLLCYYGFKKNWLQTLAEIGMTETEIVEWTNRVKRPKKSSGASNTANSTYDAEIMIAKRNVQVELITRKAALQIDDNDVIVEIYDSWYELFNVVRNELKRLPVPHGELAEHFMEILNEILRPHLTVHQAKFREWFEAARREPKYQTISPQEVQSKYPDYEVLKKSLSETNRALFNASEKLNDLR